MDRKIRYHKVESTANLVIVDIDKVRDINNLNIYIDTNNQLVINGSWADQKSREVDIPIVIYEKNKERGQKIRNEIIQFKNHNSYEINIEKEIDFNIFLNNINNLSIPFSTSTSNFLQLFLLNDNNSNIYPYLGVRHVGDRNGEIYMREKIYNDDDIINLLGNHEIKLKIMFEDNQYIEYIIEINLLKEINLQISTFTDSTNNMQFTEEFNLNEMSLKKNVLDYMTLQNFSIVNETIGDSNKIILSSILSKNANTTAISYISSDTNIESQVEIYIYDNLNNFESIGYLTGDFSENFGKFMSFNSDGTMLLLVLNYYSVQVYKRDVENYNFFYNKTYNDVYDVYLSRNLFCNGEFLIEKGYDIDETKRFVVSSVDFKIGDNRCGNVILDGSIEKQLYQTRVDNEQFGAEIAISGNGSILISKNIIYNESTKKYFSRFETFRVERTYEDSGKMNNLSIQIVDSKTFDKDNLTNKTFQDETSMVLNYKGDIFVINNGDQIEKYKSVSNTWQLLSRINTIEINTTDFILNDYFYLFNNNPSLNLLKTENFYLKHSDNKYLAVMHNQDRILIKDNNTGAWQTFTILTLENKNYLVQILTHQNRMYSFTKNDIGENSAGIYPDIRFRTYANIDSNIYTFIIDNFVPVEIIISNNQYIFKELHSSKYFYYNSRLTLSNDSYTEYSVQSVSGTDFVYDNTQPFLYINNEVLSVNHSQSQIVSETTNKNTWERFQILTISNTNYLVHIYGNKIYSFSVDTNDEIAFNNFTNFTNLSDSNLKSFIFSNFIPVDITISNMNHIIKVSSQYLYYDSNVERLKLSNTLYTEFIIHDGNNFTEIFSHSSQRVTSVSVTSVSVDNYGDRIGYTTSSSTKFKSNIFNLYGNGIQGEYNTRKEFLVNDPLYSPNGLHKVVLGADNNFVLYNYLGLNIGRPNFSTGSLSGQLNDSVSKVKVLNHNIVLMNNSDNIVYEMDTVNEFYKSYYVFHHRSDSNYDNLFPKHSVYNDSMYEERDNFNYVVIPFFSGATIYTHNIEISSNVNFYKGGFRDLQGNEIDLNFDTYYTIYTYKNLPTYPFDTVNLYKTPDLITMALDNFGNLSIIQDSGYTKKKIDTKIIDTKKPILHWVSSFDNCGGILNNDTRFNVTNIDDYEIGESLLTWGCQNYDTNMQLVQVMMTVPNANTLNDPPTDVTGGTYVVEYPVNEILSINDKDYDLSYISDYGNQILIKDELFKLNYVYEIRNIPWVGDNYLISSSSIQKRKTVINEISNLTNRDLSLSKFNNLRVNNLSNVSIDSNIEISDCIFDDRTIVSTNFTNIVFNNCSFVGTIFRNLTFADCIFNNCNLTNASFDNTIVTRTEYFYTLFDSCIIFKSQFIESDLMFSTINGSIFYDATFDENTLLPEGYYKIDSKIVGPNITTYNLDFRLIDSNNFEKIDIRNSSIFDIVDLSTFTGQNFILNKNTVLDFKNDNTNNLNFDLNFVLIKERLYKKEIFVNGQSIKRRSLTEKNIISNDDNDSNILNKFFIEIDSYNYNDGTYRDKIFKLVDFNSSSFLLYQNTANLNLDFRKQNNLLLKIKFKIIPLTDVLSFTMRSDDGIRIKVNDIYENIYRSGNPSIQDPQLGWKNQSATTYIMNKTNVIRNQTYDIQIEYYNAGGGGSLELISNSPVTSIFKYPDNNNNNYNDFLMFHNERKLLLSNSLIYIDSNTIFENEIFRDQNIENIDINNSVIKSCIFENITFILCDMFNVKFNERCIFKNCQFRQCNLRGCNFNDSIFENKFYFENNYYNENTNLNNVSLSHITSIYYNLPSKLLPSNYIKIDEGLILGDGIEIVDLSLSFLQTFKRITLTKTIELNQDSNESKFLLNNDYKLYNSVIVGNYLQITNKTFQNIVFENLNLYSTHFIDCTFIECIFSYNIDFGRASFKNCFIEDCDFTRCDFKDSKFSTCIIQNSIFELTNLSNVTFHYNKIGPLKNTFTITLATSYKLNSNNFIIGPRSSFKDMTIENFNLEDVDISQSDVTNANMNIITVNMYTKMTDIDFSKSKNFGPLIGNLWLNVPKFRFISPFILGKFMKLDSIQIDNINLENVDIYGTTFSNCQISNITVGSTTNLAFSIFENTSVKNISFQDTNYSFTNDRFYLNNTYVGEGLIVDFPLEQNHIETITKVFKGVIFKESIENLNIESVKFDGSDFSNVTLKNLTVDSNTSFKDCIFTNTTPGPFLNGNLQPQFLPNETFKFDKYIIGPNINLSSLILEELNFEDANLSEINFENSILKNCKINNNTNFLNCTTNNAVLGPFIIEDTNFDSNLLVFPTEDFILHENSQLMIGPNIKLDTNLSDLSFTSIVFQNISFGENFSVNNCTFDSVLFQNLNFNGKSLTYCTFNNLLVDSNTDFKNCNFSNSTLENIDLSGKNFTNTNLSSCSINNCDLKEANIENTNLSSSSINNCDLKEANIENASFENAIFRNTSLERLKVNEFTNWQNITLNDTNDTNFEKNTLSYFEGMFDSNLFPTYLKMYVLTGQPSKQIVLIGESLHYKEVDFRNIIFDLPNTNFSNCLIEKCNLKNNYFKNQNIVKFDNNILLFTETGPVFFEDSNNLNLNQSYKYISGYILGPSVIIKNAILKNISLEDISLSESYFDNCILDHITCNEQTLLNNTIFNKTKFHVSSGTLQLTYNGIKKYNQMENFLVGEGLSLESEDLSGFSIKDVDLRGCSLERCILSNTSFENVIVDSNTNFKSSIVENTSTGPFLANDTNTKNLMLPSEKYKFIDNDISQFFIIGPNISLINKTLTGANFDSCSFENCHLENININSNTSFLNSNFSGSTIIDIYGNTTNLDVTYKIINNRLVGPNINLKAVDFSNQILSDLSLENSDLSFCNLEGCKMQNVNLYNSIMNNVKTSQETELENTSNFSKTLQTKFQIKNEVVKFGYKKENLPLGSKIENGDVVKHNLFFHYTNELNKTELRNIFRSVNISNYDFQNLSLNNYNFEGTSMYNVKIDEDTELLNIVLDSNTIPGPFIGSTQNLNNYSLVSGFLIGNNVHLQDKILSDFNLKDYSNMLFENTHFSTGIFDSISNTSFKNCEFSDIQFESFLHGSNFIDCKFVDSTLSGDSLTMTNFIDCSFNESEFNYNNYDINNKFQNFGGISLVINVVSFNVNFFKDNTFSGENSYFNLQFNEDLIDSNLLDFYTKKEMISLINENMNKDFKIFDEAVVAKNIVSRDLNLKNTIIQNMNLENSVLEDIIVNGETLFQNNIFSNTRLGPFIAEVDSNDPTLPFKFSSSNINQSTTYKYLNDFIIGKGTNIQGLSLDNLNLEDLDLSDCVVDSNTSFKNSVFMNTTSGPYIGTLLEENLPNENYFILENTIFGEGCLIKDIDFVSHIFDGTNFGSISFDNVTFNNCSFINSEFPETISFSNTITVFKSCLFQNFLFDSNQLHYLQFENCNFYNINGIIYDTNIFKRLFNDTIIVSNTLYNYDFSRKSLENMDFSSITFLNCVFDETTLNQNTNLLNTDFKSCSFLSPFLYKTSDTTNSDTNILMVNNSLFKILTSSSNNSNYIYIVGPENYYKFINEEFLDLSDVNLKDVTVEYRFNSYDSNILYIDNDNTIYDNTSIFSSSPISVGESSFQKVTDVKYVYIRPNTTLRNIRNNSVTKIDFDSLTDVKLENSYIISSTTNINQNLDKFSTIIGIDVKINVTETFLLRHSNNFTLKLVHNSNGVLVKDTATGQWQQYCILTLTNGFYNSNYLVQILSHLNKIYSFSENNIMDNSEIRFLSSINMSDNNLYKFILNNFVPVEILVSNNKYIFKELYSSKYLYFNSSMNRLTLSKDYYTGFSFESVSGNNFVLNNTSPITIPTDTNILDVLITDNILNVKVNTLKKIDISEPFYIKDISDNKYLYFGKGLGDFWKKDDHKNRPYNILTLPNIGFYLVLILDNKIYSFTENDILERRDWGSGYYDFTEIRLRTSIDLPDDNDIDGNIYRFITDNFVPVEIIISNNQYIFKELHTSKYFYYSNDVLKLTLSNNSFSKYTFESVNETDFGLSNTNILYSFTDSITEKTIENYMSDIIIIKDQTFTFSNAQFREYSQFTNCQFNGMVTDAVQSENFLNVTFKDCLFSNCNFSYIKIENCSFENCIFNSSKLSYSQLINSSLQDITFEDTIVPKLIFDSNTVISFKHKHQIFENILDTNHLPDTNIFSLIEKVSFYPNFEKTMLISIFDLKDFNKENLSYLDFSGYDFTNHSFVECDLSYIMIDTNTIFHSTLTVFNECILGPINVIGDTNEIQLPDGYYFASYVRNNDSNFTQEFHIFGPNVNIKNLDFTELIFPSFPDFRNINLDSIQAGPITIQNFNDESIDTNNLIDTNLIDLSLYKIINNFIFGPRLSLKNVNLDQVDLSNVDLSYSTLNNCKLKNIIHNERTNLEFTNFSNSSLGPFVNEEIFLQYDTNNHHFINGHLFGLFLHSENEQFQGFDFSNKDLSNSFLHNIYIDSNTNFYNTNFHSCESGLLLGDTNNNTNFNQDYYIVSPGYIIGPHVQLDSTAVFENLTFSNKDLRGIHFDECSFKNCLFENCNLSECKLDGVTFENCTLNNINFINTYFPETIIFKNSIIINIESSMIDVTKIDTDAFLYYPLKRKLLGNGINMDNYQFDSNDSLNNYIFNSYSSLQNPIFDRTLSGPFQGSLLETNLSSSYQIVSSNYIIGPYISIEGQNMDSFDFSNIQLSNLYVDTNTILTNINFNQCISGPLLGTLSEENLSYPYRFNKQFIIGPNIMLENQDFSNCIFAKFDFTNCYVNIMTNFTNTIFDYSKTGPFIGDLDSNKLSDNYTYRSNYILGPKIDLSNTNIQNLDLRGVNLTKADLTNAILENVLIDQNTNLTDIVFDNTKITIASST